MPSLTPLTPGTGSVTATPSGTTITASLGITAVDGRPHLAVLSSSVNVDSFKIHFDGKVGWLYNLLVGLFKGAIKKAVVGAVQKSLNTALAGSLNKAFAKLKTTQYLGGGKSRMTVNTSVTTFTFGSDYMSVGKRTRTIHMYSVDHHRLTPCAASPPHSR